VIIPTIGRETLEQAKASAAGADELIVIEDQSGDHGYSAREKGIAQATGTHLAFLDDDDVFVPGAIEIMRECEAAVPTIFRMIHPRHGILWRTPEMYFGNVGTPMMLIPNRPNRLGRWEEYAGHMDEPGGDYSFLTQTIAKMGEPIWRREVVALVQPPERSPGPSITVVTPWLNHLELAEDFQVAIAAGRPDELLIVDDGSAPPLDWAHLRSEQTAGFSASCNAGLEQAASEAVLFLNNDIALREVGWLEQVRVELESGVLVGANLRFDPHGDVDGRRLPYLDGWCLAGMADELRELGGFDADYMEPAYFSDNDLCLRARLAGMTLREAHVGLHHKRGATTGPETDPRKLEASAVNGARYAERVRELAPA
jgi:glycosyltransferase involved in cell wall biosynthesis